MTVLNCRKCVWCSWYSEIMFRIWYRSSQTNGTRKTIDYGLYSTETSHHSNPGLIKMESSLLDIGANDSVVQGLFYMVPVFYQGQLFIR